MSNSTPSYQSYHEPDSTWDAFGIKDFSEFNERNVIKGQFHKNVPEDIIKSYKIVEYLMAHSYYHYPMYDEAITKATLIFEMAIKLRCTQLDIKLKNNNGREKILNNLIKELANKESIKDMSQVFNWIRQIRNFRVHPERMTFGFGVVSNIFHPLVALLNKMFHNSETWSEITNQYNLIEEDFIKTLSTSLILNYNDKRYIIHKIELLDAVKVNDSWIYNIVLHPIINNLLKNLIDGKVSPPLVFTITNLTLHNEKLMGEIYDSNESILIEVNNDERNIETIKKYESELSTLNESKNSSRKFMLDSSYHNFIGKRQNQFQYEFYHLIT